MMLKILKVAGKAALSLTLTFAMAVFFIVPAGTARVFAAEYGPDADITFESTAKGDILRGPFTLRVTGPDMVQIDDGSHYTTTLRPGQSFTYTGTGIYKITNRYRNYMYYLYMHEIQEYTITFDANGGSGSMDPQKELQDSEYTLPECAFTAPEGKDFDKWDKGAPGAKITITGDTVITAQWKDHVHTLTKTEEVPATCEEDGTEAYWTCSGCGKMFSDAEGTAEIDEPVAISALGHDWGEWTVTREATESEEGEKTRVCKRDSSHTETCTIDKLTPDTDDDSSDEEDISDEDGSSSDDSADDADSDSSDSSDSSGSSKSPKTGDQSNAIMWGSSLVLAGALLSALAVRRRKRSDRSSYNRGY